MSLSGDLLRGHTDAIILSILNRGDNYGYSINSLISDESDGEFKLTEATLYTSFKRLESSGLIESYWQDGDHGVRRKYYSITKKGLDYLSEHIASYYKTQEILKKFLGGSE